MPPRASFFVVFLALLSALSGVAQVHPFSVKDDIAMSRFSDPNFDPAIPGSDVAKPSPLGDYIAIVTTKGLLDSDEIESELTVFRTKEISAFLEDRGEQPRPRVIASIVSYPHREQTDSYAPMIKDIRWSPDGKSVCFRGESKSGAYRLYVASAEGRGFRALTPASQSVDRFDVVGDTIVYKASTTIGPTSSPIPKINSDAYVATGARIQDVVFQGQLNALVPESFSVWVLHQANGIWRSRRVPGDTVRDTAILSWLFPFEVSPDRKWLLVAEPISEIPSNWQRFDPASDVAFLRLRPSASSRLVNASEVLRPLQYTLIDLGSGRRIPLTDAPNARSLGYALENNRAAWAPDQKRVLVTNTFLGQMTGDASVASQPCAVASFDLPSLTARCVFPEDKSDSNRSHVEEVVFGASDSEAIVTVTDKSDRRLTQRYRLQQSGWHLDEESPTSDVRTGLTASVLANPAAGNDIKVSIRQGLNDPSKLWASNSHAEGGRLLWDPNPQLSRMSFGDVSKYQWKDKTGRTWSGLLVKPVGYEPGKRYPLVVQMYNYVDQMFMTDGHHPTAFAARHLASAGFVVLQVRRQHQTLSEAEPQVHLEGYRSAIDSLDSAGLVDRNRVGVVGFSWTCWYVANAIVKDPLLFKAAVIADGLDNSYMQFLMFGAGSESIARQMAQIRESTPFGTGLDKWMKEAPGFHSDQVQAAVRIEAINPSSVIQEWELYASLSLQNKPVDLIYFPHGTHIHQRPLERLESQQGTVDWFRFWLQGYEDPDPAKAAQYLRWHELHRLRENIAPISLSSHSDTRAPSLP